MKKILFVGILWATMRAATFLYDLGNNLSQLVKLEEHENKPGLKGLEGLKRQFTPKTIKSLLPEEE